MLNKQGENTLAKLVDMSNSFQSFQHQVEERSERLNETITSIKAEMKLEVEKQAEK